LSLGRRDDVFPIFLGDTSHGGSLETQGRRSGEPSEDIVNGKGVDVYVTNGGGGISRLGWFSVLLIDVDGECTITSKKFSVSSVLER
jgi:hypothetical protein